MTATPTATPTATLNATLNANRIAPIAFAAVSLLSGCGVPAVLSTAPIAAEPATSAAITPALSSALAPAATRATYSTLATGSNRMRALPVPTLAMRSVLSGVAHSSTIKDSVFKVLRTAGEAAQALAQVEPAKASAFAAVDFSRSEVLLVALGQQPGMVRVAITGVEDHGTRLHVQSARTFPKVEFPTMDIAWPYHAVVVDRADKPVEFAPVVDVDPNAGRGNRRYGVRPVGAAPIR